jgi:hypothetical protein
MRQHGNLDFIVKVITYDELFGPVPSDSEAIEIIARLPRGFTLKALSALVVLTSRLVISQAVQLKLLSMVATQPVEFVSAIRGLLQADEKRVFFYEESVTAAIALVCKYGANSPAEELNLMDLFKLLALTNSLLGDAAKESVGPAVGDLLRREHLMIGEVRSLFSGTVDFIQPIWRYSQLVDWQPTPRAPHLPHPLSEEFQMAIGMPFGEYATVMMAISAHALQIVNPPMPEVLSLLLLVKDQWFANLPDQTAVDAFLALNSTTPEKVGSAIGDGSLTSQAVNWRSAFLKAPLVQIAPGEYCYTFFPALPETLGRAFFSRLLQHYNETYERKVGDAFLDYYGRFLEDYVFTLLSQSIRKQVVGDEEAFATKDTSDNRIVDAVVIETPDITFVEVTAKRFNLTKTIIGGSIESLECDLKQMVVEKAEQLQAAVQLFDDGKLSMVPVQPSQIKRQHTVLVLQEFPQYAAVRRRAIELAREAGVTLPNLQFVTVEELEMVEPSLRKGYRLGDIIRRKSRKPDEAEMSLRNWVVTRSPNLARRRPGDLIERHRDWFEGRLAQLQQWGFETAQLTSSANVLEPDDREQVP